MKCLQENFDYKAKNKSPFTFSLSYLSLALVSASRQNNLPALDTHSKADTPLQLAAPQVGFTKEQRRLTSL